MTSTAARKIGFNPFLVIGTAFTYAADLLGSLRFSHDAAYRIQSMMTLTDEELRQKYGIERREIFDFVSDQART